LYTGVVDGRVVSWDGEWWVPFATVSPRWTQELCGGPMTSPLEYLPSEHICSRPLELFFNKIGDLYIIDAYFGLLKVGPEGGLATPLATEAEVVRFNFTNDPDLDDEGNIYFTDSRIHYQRRSPKLTWPSGEIAKYNTLYVCPVKVASCKYQRRLDLTQAKLNIYVFLYCESSLFVCLL
ncbi:hypothetical protein ACJX0J_042416, partial [Zea mays]